MSNWTSNVLTFVCVLTVFYTEIGVVMLVVSKSRCSTPPEWLDNGIDAVFPLEADIDGKYFKPYTKWPRGVVKYILNTTLSEEDRKLVFLAFEEFHKKTCLKFEPRSDGDMNYVSIERNNNVECGLAHVCMQKQAEDGYQFVRFGDQCANKATVVHELGHTVCLGHEHERPDRDNFVSYEGCKVIPTKATRSIRYGIYDFESQTHYDCESCYGGYPKSPYNVSGCGEQVGDGLSVLDADTINALYDCQDCRRHRWIPASNFGKTDTQNLPDFGIRNVNGESLYPCRAAVYNEVLVGMYDIRGKFCVVITRTFDVKIVRNDVEVFTVPDGLGSTKHVYELIEYNHVSPLELSQRAVYAGKFYTGDDTRKISRTAFVEFAKISKEKFIDFKVMERKLLNQMNSVADKKLEDLTEEEKREIENEVEEFVRKEIESRWQTYVLHWGQFGIWMRKACDNEKKFNCSLGERREPLGEAEYKKKERERMQNEIKYYREKAVQKWKSRNKSAFNESEFRKSWLDQFIKANVETAHVIRTSWVTNSCVEDFYFGSSTQSADSENSCLDKVLVCH